MTPDVNVLVAASRTDHPHHAPALRWLEGALEDGRSGGALLLLPMVVASFLSLVTHPRVFVTPTPIDRAVDFIDALLDAPGVRLAELGSEWGRFRELCLTHGLTANDLPDAWIAAAVQHLAEHLASFDTDFRRLLKRSELTLLAG